MEEEKVKGKVENRKKGRIEKISDFFEYVMPDAITIAIILMIIVVILALVLTKAPLITSTDTQLSIVDSIGKNFWNLLTFAMQMCLASILGTVVAKSPPANKVLGKICRIPNTVFGCYVFVCVIGALLTWVHWAVGWFGALIVARQVMVQAHNKGLKIHTPHLVATSFIICLTTGQGPSASQIAFAATPGYLKSLVDAATAANLKEFYTIIEVAVTPKAILTQLVGAILVFIVLYKMKPKEDAPFFDGMTEERLELYNQSPDLTVDKSTIAKRLSNSVVISWFLGILMLIYSIKNLMTNGFSGFGINEFNMLLFGLSLILCIRPRIFAELFKDSVMGVWGFIVQFPLYAAIFGIMTGTGLDTVISNAFLSIANTRSWPSIAFIYSAFLNIFVPSGGSKFIIEAPYIIPITQQLKVPLETILMSYGFGDNCTNMLTPFWWIAPCGICKIDYHKVMPYAVVACLVSFIYFALVMFLW